MRCGVIENGKLSTFAEAPDQLFADQMGWKALTGNEQPGWVWTEEGVFVPPPPPPYDRVGAMKKVDDLVAAIYNRFTRFDVEYFEREKAAQAYTDAEFVGDPPARVLEFSEPAGMTPQAAATLILSQAANLRSAMDQLSALRMRKYEIARGVTDELAEATANVLFASITYIGNSVS